VEMQIFAFLITGVIRDRNKKGKDKKTYEIIQMYFLKK
jgi:hypothetical protein